MSEGFIAKWCVTCAGIFLILCKRLPDKALRVAQVVCTDAGCMTFSSFSGCCPIIGTVLPLSVFHFVG